MAESNLKAGAASVQITPPIPMFLAGYPHVRRDSTGVHDPLLSSALYLENGPVRVLLIANDVIYVSKASTARCRKLISDSTGIPPQNILISATHTHSGPKTLDPIATEADASVPKTDARSSACSKKQSSPPRRALLQTPSSRRRAWQSPMRPASVRIAAIRPVRKIWPCRSCSCAMPRHIGRSRRCSFARCIPPCCTKTRR